MFSCNFVQYATDTANDDTMAIGLLWRSVPYNWEVDDYQYTVGGCTPYNWFGQSKVDIDGMFKAARGFGLVRDIVFFFNLGCFIPSLTVVCLIFQAAVTFGCAMSSVVWIIAPCIPVRKIGWTIIGLILAVIGLFQILTLLILSSDTCSFKCTNLGTGGMLSIVSGVLWFISAALCCLAKEPVESRNPVAVGTPSHQLGASPETQNHQILEQRITTQQRVEPDGTIVIEKTTTRADGGVTVTTETFPPGTAVGAVNAYKMQGNDPYG